MHNRKGHLHLELEKEKETFFLVVPISCIGWHGHLSRSKLECF